MSLNDGFFDGGSGPRGSANMGSATWRKRASNPIYTGRTSAYDFDEHFRSHYSRPRTAASASSYNSSKYSSYSGPMTGRDYKEDLNKYWNKREREFEAQDGISEIRNRIFVRALILITVLYACVSLLNIKVDEENKKGMLLMPNRKTENENQTKKT